MAGTVIVFDFDDTIIDCDSDCLVADGLGVANQFSKLLESMPWNTAAIRMVEQVHLQGRSVDDIADTLRRAPLSPNAAAVIKSAHALGSELCIVSDANTFYIVTILKQHGLVDCFSEILTNPSYVDGEGKLRIFPYHDYTVSSHGCGLCPPNLCKGAIVEKMRQTAIKEGKKQFIYVGDGKGDYCPSLMLTDRDCVMPRKNFALSKLISDKPDAVKAEIHEWTDAAELATVLLRLVTKSVFTDGSMHLSSANRKFPSAPPLSSL